MKYSKEEIGNIIKKERLKLNWSQETLGKELKQKSGAKQISTYEQGTIPPLNVMLKLCDIFNCELGYLLGEDDYTSGNKLDTAIEDKLGLTRETIDALHHITGNDKKCLRYGRESDDYIRILNNILSSNAFACLIDTIYDLDNEISAEKKIWNDLIKKHGKETFDKSLEYYHSKTDYLDDECAEELPKIYYDVIAEIDRSIDKKTDAEYKIKVHRYEVQEEFESLMNSLYPR